ncbi:MAG: PIN domain-containing protein [Bacteroidia bacterium]
MNKVNILLDSTVLHNDPLFKNPFGRLLLELQIEGRLDIFISKVVWSESLNNYEKQLREIQSAIKKESDALNRITFENYDPKLKPLEELLSAYTTFYNESFDAGRFVIVDYEESLLPQLIQRSIKRIKPFTEARQEFRDAIIWMSYVTYIKKNKLKNNHFITNNKRDFWDDNNTDLHPHLRAEISDLKVYANYQELFTKEKQILNIIKERDFTDWLSKQSVLEPDILKLIKEKLWSPIKNKINESIDKLNPQLYFPDIKAVYFEYNYQKENIILENFTVSQISNFGYVECKILIDGLAIIYPREYNWTKEKRPIVFNIDLSFTFDINMNITDFNISKIEINYNQLNSQAGQ